MGVVSLGIMAISFAFMLFVQTRRPLPVPSVASTAMVSPTLTFFVAERPISVALFFGLLIGGGVLGLVLHGISAPWGPAWQKQSAPALLLSLLFIGAFLAMQFASSGGNQGLFQAGIAAVAAAGGLWTGYAASSRFRPHPRTYTPDEALAELRQVAGRRGQPGGDLEPLVLQVYAQAFPPGALAMGAIPAGNRAALPPRTAAQSAPHPPVSAKPAARAPGARVDPWKRKPALPAPGTKARAAPPSAGAAHVATPAPAPQATARPCTQCGGKLTVTQRFCPQCGTAAS